ncbi:MAG: CRISPR-associated endonuclease Cas2 [Ignavibacteriaceae bacterium]
MLLLIVYQIKDAKVRARLRKLLLNYGNPLLNGVFELRLTKAQREKLVNAVKNYESLLQKEDGITIYNICSNCLQKTIIIGKKPITNDPLYYYV